MAMFTAYFDASGNAEQPESFVIVSGYIANYLQWRAFEVTWAAIHSQFGVKTPFHMTTFMAALSNPDRYASQRDARADYVALAKDSPKAQEFFKQICLAQLSMIICGVSCIVDMRTYEGMSLLLDLRDKIPPYALAARTCVAQVHQWESHFSIQEPVECIFERGDLEQDKFTDLVRRDGGDPPIYKDKKDYAGLQAADHYAWEQFHYMKKSRTGSYIPAREPLKFLLNLIPCIHAQVTQESILHICHDRGIDPKTGITK